MGGTNKGNGRKLNIELMATPKIRGVAQLLKKLDKFGEDGRRYAVAVTNQTAQNIANKARVRAPVDLGALRQSIGNTEATAQANRSLIYATARYAPYVNWGTGGLVNVEPIFTDLAIKFKGKGIRQINLIARPFLTGSYLEEALEYPKRLKAALKKLTDQFNRK